MARPISFSSWNRVDIGRGRCCVASERGEKEANDHSIITAATAAGQPRGFARSVRRRKGKGVKGKDDSLIGLSGRFRDDSHFRPSSSHFSPFPFVSYTNVTQLTSDDCSHFGPTRSVTISHAPTSIGPLAGSICSSAKLLRYTDHASEERHFRMTFAGLPAAAKRRTI